MFKSLYTFYLFSLFFLPVFLHGNKDQPLTTATLSRNISNIELPKTNALITVEKLDLSPQIGLKFRSYNRESKEERASTFCILPEDPQQPFTPLTPVPYEKPVLLSGISHNTTLTPQEKALESTLLLSTLFRYLTEKDITLLSMDNKKLRMMLHSQRLSKYYRLHEHYNKRRKNESDPIFIKLLKQKHKTPKKTIKKERAHSEAQISLTYSATNLSSSNMNLLPDGSFDHLSSNNAQPNKKKKNPLYNQKENAPSEKTFQHHNTGSLWSIFFNKEKRIHHSASDSKINCRKPKTTPTSWTQPTIHSTGHLLAHLFTRK